ncbi:OPA3-like protein [Bidens hawaiensis]|uniref:OPA3-like protein n=1 Tax=Bidens hawaiensis TaxID=980011 RepID=UPI00404A3550
MVLPLLKLGTLALRTLSKPIASRLKQHAATHPKFRASIIGLAQANHRLTTNIQRRIYGHATDVEIRPLNEEKAVQAAGDLIGELFVFSVAGLAVIFEEARKQEFEVLRQRDEDLAKELECLNQKIEELEQLAKGKGLAGVFNFKNIQTQDANSSKSP